MKKPTRLLRSAFAVACCLGGMTASLAQAEIPSVVASGGATNDAICCTIGETFAGDNMGMWADATDITTGINGVYSDGGIIVENAAGNHSLKVQLTEEMIANGVFYNVYTISGMLLERNRIEESPYTLNYEHLLTGKHIIVTFQTAQGTVATYKLTK